MLISNKSQSYPVVNRNLSVQMPMSIPIVLVANDDKADQSILTLLLRKFDYDIQIVPSAESAITFLATNTYAAILISLALPGLDLVEFKERVRLVEIDSGRRTPVIALMSNSEATDRCEIVPPTMVDSMTRPFNPEQLRKMLLRCVYDSRQPNLKTLKPLPPEDFDIFLAAI
jgi:CheY-like chemotaxis protein